MSNASGKQPMYPPAAAPAAANSVATLAMPPPQWPGPMRYRANDDVHSRASDAGSAKNDSNSDAGSTATEKTSRSTGTLASNASTVFFSQQVHSFTLDDFAGQEIQTILEDGGETHLQQDHDMDGQSADGKHSVRPNSIVSNMDRRLSELDGLGPVETASEALADMAQASAEEPGSSEGTSADAVMESQYQRLLQQMQHRELTPEDLQLLMAIERRSAS